METCFVARDNSGVLTVKLGRETSLVAYSTDKRSKRNLRKATKFTDVCMAAGMFCLRRQKICDCPKLSSYLRYFKRKTTFGHINAAEVAFLVFLIDFRYFVCIRIYLPWEQQNNRTRPRKRAYTSYRWFASDVTTAMLVVKNKSISLRWEMNSILVQI